MKHFYLIPNYEKKEVNEIINRVVNYVKLQGGTAVTAEKERAEDGSFRFLTPVPEDTEAVITLGGDGTIIESARALLERKLPIIGFNLGHLGFLTECDRNDVESALSRLLSDEFYIQERMILHGRLIRNGEVIQEGPGINDIVLHSAGRTRAVEFEFLVNEEHLKTYFGDGMIIASPTGSTAYSLSAGGPIVMPSAEMIIATPVCSHSMISRSIVLPDSVTVSLKVSMRPGTEASVSFDNLTREVMPGDEIRITKSCEKIRLIRLKRDSFIEVLRTKLEN